MEPDSCPQLIIMALGHKFSIKPEIIDCLSAAICASLDLAHYEVSWNFVEPTEIQALNREYRQQDKTTDVLSFPQEEWEQAKLFLQPTWPLQIAINHADKPTLTLGDVVISPANALQNAETIGNTLDREVAFLLVHGILHLCGHDHIEADEEKLMLTQQKSIMNFLEHTQKQPLWTGCCEVEN